MKGQRSDPLSESKGGGVQGLQDGKEELLGLHFFRILKKTTPAKKPCRTSFPSWQSIPLRRNDPAYSAWVDAVIEAGKIAVHPERQEHKGAQRQIYFKWLKDSEEFNAAEEKQLTKAQLDLKKLQIHISGILKTIQKCRPIASATIPKSDIMPSRSMTKKAENVPWLN